LPDFHLSKFEEIIWRQTALGIHPLDTQGSFLYGGRFNPPALFQMLYTSFSTKGVRAEFLKFAKSRDTKPDELLPREVHQLFVALVNVIDLTDSRNLKILDCSVRKLLDKDWRVTQNIGLRLNGTCDAIISYSAAAPKEKNLILYEPGIRRTVIVASSVIDVMSDWDKIVS